MVATIRGTFDVSCAEAEDAVSGAVEALMTENDLRFDGLTGLRAWLLKSARFRILDLKKHKRILRAEDLEDCMDEIEKKSQYNIEHIFDGLDTHCLMLLFLNFQERSVINAHHLLELTFEEMAALRTDGLDPAALRQRYHRALKKLIAHIKNRPTS